MKRALFLFNHDAAHQVAHLVGVAAATARSHPEIETVIAYAPAIRAEIDKHIAPDDAALIRWEELSLTGWRAALARALDRVLPATRIARLHANVPLFASADIVVSTERTCLRLKRHFEPGTGPKFAKIPHGAGDRSVAWHDDYRRFDLTLVAGEKVVDQLVRNGVERDRIAIVGYPKFDSLADSAPPPPLFDNGRPTFVYNPHFDPHLSSWYECGPELLRWFAGPEGQAYNLVFAPHVMLFRKSLHVSPEYKTSRRRPDVPPEALAAPNILVDTDGPRLFDMTYTRAADAYIGDASSQVYEFLARPRACFFLDCRKQREGDPDLLSWQTGPVCRSAADLAAVIPEWQAIADQYRAEQRRLFAYTIDLGDKPANLRAADAIASAISG